MPEVFYVFVVLGGVGFVVALALGLAFASTWTRFVLLGALGLALSLVADWAGLDSEHCEGECYGDLVRWRTSSAGASVSHWPESSAGLTVGAPREAEAAHRRARRTREPRGA
jgi:hypothetical protein